MMNYRSSEVQKFRSSEVQEFRILEGKRQEAEVNNFPFSPSPSPFSLSTI
jgi:hypothetical protein